MKNLILLILFIAFFSLEEADCQWNTNGNHIYNTNPGFVGIGTSNPATLLYAARNMTEPNITVRNLGGTGGATFTMTDDASGANWKFKATLSGGFKIRDHANSLDVIVIEPGSFANAIYIKSTDNIGIGTSTPASSAVLDVNSSVKGFLLPRMTISQILAIADPVDGLLVYCTTDKRFYAYNGSAAVWNALSFVAGATIDPDFNCGDSLIITHTLGDVAPVSKIVTYNTSAVSWFDPDLCWILSNLGADHQASAVDDTTEASAGWYWQFNHKRGYKHDGAVRTPNTDWIQYIEENSDWQSPNDPCTIELGPAWRLPTFTEYDNLDNLGGWNDWNGPWAQPLRMHAAGYVHDYYDSLYSRGVEGIYWSNSQFGMNRGWMFYLQTMGCVTDIFYKANGLPVRCVREM